MIRRTARQDLHLEGEVSDEALLAAIAAGDERAAVAFVRRYQRRLFGLAFGLLGDSALAEDVVQEAFLRVWRHAAIFDARRAAARTWVLTITRNLAIDAMRLRRSAPVSPDDLSRLLGSDPRAEEEFNRSPAAEEVRKALRTLPHEQQRALVLATLYGYTAAEVAATEGIPLGTAKSRIRLAMLKLHHLVEEEDDAR